MTPTTSTPTPRFNPRRPHGRRLRHQHQHHAQMLFQSAPPSRAATSPFFGLLKGGFVSIRAALTGGDTDRTRESARGACFNPRRPHGRRRGWSGNRFGDRGFQSAPPSRAATRVADSESIRPQVSIRAALTGGDAEYARRNWRCRSFNPRRPHGRRPLASSRSNAERLFQSAPPSRAAT